MRRAAATIESLTEVSAAILAARARRRSPGRARSGTAAARTPSAPRAKAEGNGLHRWLLRLWNAVDTETNFSLFASPSNACVWISRASGLHM